MPYKISKDNNQYCVFNTDTNEKKGCSDSRDKATKHMQALYAAEGQAAIAQSLFDEAMADLMSTEGQTSSVEEPELLVEEESMADLQLVQPRAEVKEFAWEGPIVFENVLTGDNRIFKPNSITWAEETLPWPFRWQRSSIEGHKGAIPIGRVDKLERKPDGTIYGYGVIIPTLNDEAAEYLRLLEAGVASGVSVDGDSAEFDVQEAGPGKTKIEFSSMRLRSLTAVDIPAFNEARVSLAEVEDEEEMKKKRKKKMGWAYNLTAAAIPVKPPVEWFADPELREPSPISVTPEGKVIGHLALFETCHIGLPGCVTPPKNATYKYFHTGEIETVEGDCVEVGHLTFNTGHAALSDSAKQAASHYDHTGSVAADVRCGEDKYGIWVSGAMRSHLSDEDVRAFRAAPLSGDWRRIAGKLELVGALAVNVPGFPVPRARALVSSGHTEALITFAEDEEDMFSEEDLQLRKEKRDQLAQKAQVTFQAGDSLTKESLAKMLTPAALEAKGKSITADQLKAHLKEIRDTLDDEDDPDEELSDKDRELFESVYSEGQKLLKSKFGIEHIEEFSLQGEDLATIDVEEFHPGHANQSVHGKKGSGSGGSSKATAPKGGAGAPGSPISKQAAPISAMGGKKTKEFGKKIKKVTTSDESAKLGKKMMYKAGGYAAVGIVASAAVLLGTAASPFTMTVVGTAALIAAGRNIDKASAYDRQTEHLRSQGK